MADPNQAIFSNSFDESKNKAEEYIRDPKKITELLNNAWNKMNKEKSVFGEFKEYLDALIRMTHAIYEGKYKNISWSSLVMIVAGLIYFVSPVDFIPDFILIGGYLDDAVIITFVASLIKSDLDDFIAWENTETGDES